MEGDLKTLDRLFQACDTFLPEVVAILHELPLNYASLSTNISDLLWGAEQNTEGRQGMAIEEGVRA